MRIDNEALSKFLNDIYGEMIFTVLDNQEIKEIEDFYNKNYDKFDDINDFYSLDKKIARNIKKVKSVKAEVERQFEINKRLQSGTLCECVMAETIANIYNLDSFADVFHTYIRELPANILYRLRDDNNRILCRYIYYNKEDLNTFLIQYGNPTRYDADLYIDNQIVKLEFKDRIARAGEKETEYDDNGKLIYSEKFAEENPDYIPLIERFNEEYNIIDLPGNYQIDDEDDKKAMLKAYFKNLGFESLVSVDENSQLVAITEDCIEVHDGKEFLSLAGSEIRRAGKNSYSVFTKELLKKSIEEINGSINDDIVKIPKEKMTDRINNGRVTGKKINHLFFVKIENIKEDSEYYIFSLSNIKQLKPTLCVHMQIISDRAQLIEYYEDILDQDE
ncbi:putative uncharacterized protein [Bacillus sp. CAG:988]|nr:putative uncharacterized protein [Bacillus sp. CAG:988]